MVMNTMVTAQELNVKLQNAKTNEAVDLISFEPQTAAWSMNGEETASDMLQLQMLRELQTQAQEQSDALGAQRQKGEQVMNCLAIRRCENCLIRASGNLKIDEHVSKLLL